MSDLGAVFDDAAKDMAQAGEKAGKAIAEHFTNIGGDLERSGTAYRSAETDAKTSFEGITTSGARAAENTTRSTAETATTGAASDAEREISEEAAPDVSTMLPPHELQNVLNPGASGAEAEATGSHQIQLFGDSATGDVSTSPGEAVFWSGATELKAGESAAWSGAKTADVGGKTMLFAGEDNAKTIARAEGKVSLESLIEDRGIKMPAWENDNPAVEQAWKDISDRYAQGVSGDVHVVLGDSLRPGNIWETVERPRLESNPAVTSITKIDLKTLEESVLWRRGDP